MTSGASTAPEEPRARATRVVGALLNGAEWALVIAVAFSKWEWLEMRFNVGWILYGTWLVLVVAIILRASKPLDFGFSIANTLTCCIVCFALCRSLASFQMLPACLVREGLGMTGWSIGAVNVGIAAFVACGLSALAALKYAWYSSQEGVSNSKR